MRRALLAALLAPALLLAACATGTSPGSGGSDGPGGSGVTTDAPDPDSPTSSDDDPSTSAPPTTPTTPADPVAAELTITLDESGSGSFVTWTLTCDPDGGDHPDPAGACAALASAGGAAAFTPVPRDAVCTEIYGGPQVAHVEGTVAGEQVSGDFRRSNGCEIAHWDPLTPLLGSAGGGM